jgi:hypothetical protein
MVTVGNIDFGISHMLKPETDRIVYSIECEKIGKDVIFSLSNLKGLKDSLQKSRLEKTANAILKVPGIVNFIPADDEYDARVELVAKGDFQEVEVPPNTHISIGDFQGLWDGRHLWAK